MKAFLLLSAVAIFAIIPNSARADADACKPFSDIEEVKKEDKDAHDAIKKVKQAEGQVDEFQGFCAKQKADNTLSNQDQLISQDQNQRDAVMTKNNIAKDSLKKAQESAVAALKKMNEPETKKRPGRTECAQSLIADNDALNAARSKLDAKGAALSSCAPPTNSNGAVTGPTALHPGCPAGVACRSLSK